MSRDLQELLEGLRLQQLAEGSLVIAGELEALIEEKCLCDGGDCPCYEAGSNDARADWLAWKRELAEKVERCP